ncbi:MAG TPA: tetratricopeptide repeat protein, partial [Bacteroidales bacterium]|nr:tetratricopeptide repeat protein [Bacteroidales bacterium]
MKKNSDNTQDMRRWLFFGLMLLFSVPGFTSGEKEFVARGNKAYTDGFYADAVVSYKKVIASGYESPELYYNLGNAYFKLNEFPNAILYYEKAMKLDPGNEDIDFNLRIANSKIFDKIEPIPELFYKRWYSSLIGLMSVDGWAWMGIILFVASLVLGMLYFVTSGLFFRKTGFIGGISLMILALIFIFFAYDGFNRTRHDREAIIMNPTITVKSSPDEKSVDLFVLHEGTKV